VVKEVYLAAKSETRNQKSETKIKPKGEYLKWLK
jgi:hypothetical protein